MMCVTCHKRSRDLCAVGGGTRGCNPRKIEMFLDGMVECSDKQKTKDKDKDNGSNINYENDA